MTALTFSHEPELPLADMGPLRSARDIALDLVLAGEMLTESRAWFDAQAREMDQRWGRNSAAYFQGRRA